MGQMKVADVRPNKKSETDKKGMGNYEIEEAARDFALNPPNELGIYSTHLHQYKYCFKAGAEWALSQPSSHLKRVEEKEDSNICQFDTLNINTESYIIDCHILTPCDGRPSLFYNNEKGEIVIKFKGLWIVAKEYLTEEIKSKIMSLVQQTKALEVKSAQKENYRESVADWILSFLQWQCYHFGVIEVTKEDISKMKEQINEFANEMDFILDEDQLPSDLSGKSGELETESKEDEINWTDDLVLGYAEAHRYSSSRISLNQFKKMIRNNEQHNWLPSYKKTIEEPLEPK